MSRPRAVDAALLRAWPLRRPDADDGKEDRGRVLVVAGSRDVPGAARLAGEAALRAGAGKLQIATIAGAGTALGLLVPEARVLELPADRDGAIRAASAEVGRCAAGAQCVLIGPGMSPGAATSRLALTLASRASGAVVLDAGALAAVHDGGSDVIRVLTPHAGEMAALMHTAIARIESDPLGVATGFAREHGVFVVLKGPTTVIAAPDGEAWRYTDGAVGLATSGSGDVLAGLLAGLLARRVPPAQAAVWAVALHGAAGRALAARHGHIGFLARDLAGEVPRLLDAMAGEAAAATATASVA
jgi:ADP-dependent NAD(P)H-hydrate dehydratase